MGKIKELYIGEFSFFKKEISKIFIIFMLLFLTVAIGTGIFIYNNEKIAINLFEYIMQVFEQLNINQEPGIAMSIDLFLNNTKSAGVSILLGFVPFLFLPIIPVIFNAVILGGLIAIYPMIGLPIGAALLGTIPHGIFEISAIIYAVSLGIYLNICIFRKIIKSKKKNINMGEVLMHIVKSFILIIVPLLVIAALVEAFISPVLMGLIL